MRATFVNTQMEHAQRVSLSEIFEVRNEGFTAEEVLAVLAASCEALSKTSGGVFSPDFVFITLQGRVQVRVFCARAKVAF